MSLVEALWKGIVFFTIILCDLNVIILCVLSISSETLSGDSTVFCQQYFFLGGVQSITTSISSNGTQPVAVLSVLSDKAVLIRLSY